jgi:hypothetical protein
MQYSQNGFHPNENSQIWLYLGHFFHHEKSLYKLKLYLRVEIWHKRVNPNTVTTIEVQSKKLALVYAHYVI